MIVYHPEDEFGDDILIAFDSLPLPDKYDGHEAGFRMIDNSRIAGVQLRDSGFYTATYGHALTQQ